MPKIVDIFLFDLSMDLIEMQRYDLLIQEIEGIDDYLGPTFRYVNLIKRPSFDENFIENRAFGVTSLHADATCIVHMRIRRVENGDGHPRY